MANNLTKLPWKVDTPSDTALFTGRIFLSHITYVGSTDPAHVAEVQDKNGNLVALLSGDTILTSDHQIEWIEGLKVPLLTTDGAVANLQSGKLLLYVH